MRNLARTILLLLLCSPFALKGQIVQPYDILITELMIDPNPVVGLPNFEWVELHNRSDNSIELEGFLFSSGATRYALPSYQLAPGGYVMVCDDIDVVDLRTFGAAIEISTFPSLTNSGDAATLESPDGRIIHEVLYRKSWYGDSDKDDGGYTLELINPNDPCLAASNWIASASPTGATPAAKNSNWVPRIPAAGIIAERVVASSSTSIEVQFDRIPNMSISEMDFAIAPAITIIDISPEDEDARSFTLTLAEDLTSSVVYSLIVNSGISDCMGLSSEAEQVLDFVLPEPVASGDLVINEILFDPIGSESDYVEVFNTGGKFLDISQLMIGNLDSDGSGSTREIEVSYILGPMDYLVFTEDAAALKTRYPSAIDNKVLEVDLPSFSNAEGNVTLFIEDNGMTIVIDAFDYDEGMHAAFIDDPDGVALERVDIAQSSTDRMNWQSGASSMGYGTPTLANSQRIGAGTGSDEIVFLDQKTFYPQEAINSRLTILFETGRSDYIGTIDVFDSSGRYVDQIANNQLIGRSDRYFWDGLNQDGELMNAGIYIVVVQMVTVDGDLVTKKLPCALSRRL